MSFNLPFMEVNIKEEIKGLKKNKANKGQLQRVRDKTYIYFRASHVLSLFVPLYSIFKS